MGTLIRYLARVPRRPSVFHFVHLPPATVEHLADLFNVQTVAGVISLLNDHLISQGKKPLGFLNPWLYSGGIAGLNDITLGWNPGCGTVGFPAVTGWDPVRLSRFGSPFLALADSALYRSQVSGRPTSKNGWKVLIIRSETYIPRTQLIDCLQRHFKRQYVYVHQSFLL